VLERFVEGGGALMVFVGDRVESEAYNDLMYAEGKGLLPAKLLQARVTPASSEKFVRFDLRNVQHPVLRQLSGQGVNIGISRTRGYYALSVDEESPEVQILCRYNDPEGTPAILEKSFGAGRVAMINTTADPAWSSFAMGPFFPLFVQEMCRYLVPGSLEETNLMVGEPLRQVLFAGQFGQRVLVTDPQGDLTETLPEPTGETFLFTYKNTGRAGIYWVDFGVGNGRACYAVNLDVRESDLQRTSEDELEAALPEARINYVQDVSQLASVVEREATSQPFWRPLLYTVLVMMLLESILAQWFGNRSGVRKRKTA